MPTITWLHISDLHFQADQTYDTNVVLQALLKDVAERIREDGLRPDFIAVTGDIAHSGKPAQYALAQKFFDDLLQTVGLDKSWLFLVPGNHDVDRDQISWGARIIGNFLRDRHSTNKILSSTGDRRLMFERFQGYAAFVNDYLAGHLSFDDEHYFYVRLFELAGWQVALLGLNSAWLAHNDEDYGKLVLGERQVRQALEQAKGVDLVIALLHHPFDWLREFEQDDSVAMLLDKCDFVLHGHLHQTAATQLVSPDGAATVLACGACYKARKFANMYNWVRLDLAAKEGKVLLRAWSDRRGGFWTRDNLTYTNVEDGIYVFSLPYEVTSPRENLASDFTYEEPGIEKWWKERGYTRNPFTWSNAADVDDQELPKLFSFWHVDPGTDADFKGLGPTPTLDGVKSPDTSKLVLIYAPDGGGKTFYRRWAAQQMREEKQDTIEIRDIGGHLRDPRDVTARDLAICVYNHVRKKLSGTADPPPEYIEHVLIKCEGVIQTASISQGFKRLYVFIDDLAQLFDEQQVMAERNAQTLEALAEFCGVAARCGGGGQLALRVFIPIQLKKQLQKYLSQVRPRLQECTVQWSTDHCQAILEKRLDSCWRGGPESGLIHISRLFEPDAFDELHRWLGRQKGISPRCIINVLNQLGSYAYSHNLSANGLITAQLWSEFVESSEIDLYASKVVYPLSRPAWKLRLPMI